MYEGIKALLKNCQIAKMTLMLALGRMPNFKQLAEE